MWLLYNIPFYDIKLSNAEKTRVISFRVPIALTVGKICLLSLSAHSERLHTLEQPEGAIGVHPSPLIRFCRTYTYFVRLLDKCYRPITAPSLSGNKGGLGVQAVARSHCLQGSNKNYMGGVSIGPRPP